MTVMSLNVIWGKKKSFKLKIYRIIPLGTRFLPIEGLSMLNRSNTKKNRLYCLGGLSMISSISNKGY